MTYKMQWLNVSVKDTFEQISTRDKQVKTKDCLIKGDYPVVDQGRSLINGFVNDETKVINLNKKPIVIFGDHTRIIKWINFNFVPGADGTKLLMPKEFLIPRFFYYQLKSIDIKDRGYGRHFKILQESNFKVAPLAEQQEIVRQLDVMLAQVEQIKARLDAIPTILKKFRQSVLADAVSGKLTEEWREQNNLPLANIEKLERVVDSSFYGPRFSKDDYTDDLQNGIPTIRTTDMSDGKIIVTPTTPRIIVPPEKIEQFKVKPSDLLITRTGSIGVMALVREEYLAIPSAYLIRFRFKQNLVSSDYIYYALTSPNGQNQMGLSTTAITQPNINANSIRALEIYLPSIEEQKEIVKRVDTLFGYAARIEETIQSAQKRLNLLTQSILAKAFSGELTAEWREQHQDLITGVNSAEALLAKIQAEREASKPVKKAKRVK
ncbi:restriction endonuclease subunit S [Acinetobacter towneri]|uniref:restriction endonuclease subunit S n=1 Tax=Acinetobacter towneri TaxID=202956 RepID=UPI0014442B44|nr:restriction endonuclease subunit S [Acinetobacter towneri]